MAFPTKPKQHANTSHIIHFPNRNDFGFRGIPVYRIPSTCTSYLDVMSCQLVVEPTHLKNKLVKMGIFSQVGVNIKKCLKPTPGQSLQSLPRWPFRVSYHHIPHLTLWKPWTQQNGWLGEMRVVVCTKKPSDCTTQDHVLCNGLWCFPGMALVRSSWEKMVSPTASNGIPRIINDWNLKKTFFAPPSK